MKTHKVRVWLLGAYGRMCERQALDRSLLEFIRQGGIKIGADEVIVPEIYLLGRNEAKLKALSQKYGNLPYSSNLEEPFQRQPEPNDMLFCATPTPEHHAALKKAVLSGLHVYTEKPITTTVEDALEIHRLAEKMKVRGSVVADKLDLPGPRALKEALDKGTLGEVRHVFLEFGYYTDPRSGTRPSWNWDPEKGGIILDMGPHWDYLLGSLFGRLARVSCIAETHVKQRYQDGQPVPTGAEDHVDATFQTEKGVTCSTIFSWCRQPRRRGLFELKVQGSEGSAECYLDRCYVISHKDCERISWDPDSAQRQDFPQGWSQWEPQNVPENAFRYQWEQVLRHVVGAGENPASILDGAQGVETARAMYESARLEGNDANAWVTIRDVRQLV